jgi:hypothetical protein
MNVEYTPMFSEGDEPEQLECANCDYPAPLRSFPGKHGDVLLCQVCASTYLGFATTFPDRFTDGTELIAKSLGYLFNRLFEELGAKKNG